MHATTGATQSLRSLSKVLNFRPTCAEEVPVVIVDGVVANGQSAAEPETELYLKPRKLFRDPFRKGEHLLVLCDTFKPEVCGGIMLFHLCLL